MIPKSLCDSLGGFDKEIFIQSEDEELCYIARKNGYCVINTPNTRIVHLEGASH